MPYDKDGKYYRQPTNSVNKKNDKDDKSVGLYTCLGCLEKIPATDLDCPKCGKRTAAGKKVDFDKKWKNKTQISNSKAKSELALGSLVLVVFIIGIIGGCVAVFKDVTKERPKSAEDIKIEQLRFCEDLIKENLKDPSSYRRLTSRDEQIRTGIIRYSGTNSFGGRVQESFECF